MEDVSLYVETTSAHVRSNQIEKPGTQRLEAIVSQGHVDSKVSFSSSAAAWLQQHVRVPASSAHAI
jgi:hypothetical protein